MKGRNESVILSYQPSNESVAITRDLSLSSDLIHKEPRFGTLRLWDTRSEGEELFTTEPLNIRVFMDGSALEVFINDVFVMSTRIYYWYPDSTQMGFWYRLPKNIPSDTSCDTFNVSWSNVQVWEGLFDAYPKRPKNPIDPSSASIG
ncbi:hypothetical protein CF327_g6045 [Tilletia walkeri]|nr:hypothetical protein CF327_g6045 [Tilletia walkeri]